MMTKIIGFIGVGNMGSAILKGLLNSEFARPENIIASRRNADMLAAFAEDFGIQTTTDNKIVAAKADILFLAVKPHMYEDVIKEVRDDVGADTIVVNIAAGVSIADIEDYFGHSMKVVRAMPNTPSLVGEGMVGVCFNKRVSTDEQNEIVNLFSKLGTAEVITEDLINAVIGVSGSSPAILYMVVEALADSAVKNGMPRNQAYIFAAQAMVGGGKMVLETGEHPGKLKDDVCSPGGGTIEAVIAAEDKGLRSAIMAAVDATVQKSIRMEK